ncbi:MAG: sugar ABC transporter ATP-binding protein [Solirubrobacteraceae bacterium]|jgi:ABC-type sugar transport system ATPase subunit
MSVATNNAGDPTQGVAEEYVPARYEAHSITKTFGGAHALTKASVTFEPGEIHTLVGENGAGKSTMLKVMAGIHHRDGGELVLNGEQLRNLTPRTAIANGIYLVPQEPTPMLTLSALENLFVGIIPSGRFRWSVDWKAMERSAGAYFEQVGLDIDPHQPASELSVAQQQLLECARALTHRCNVIFFDEPTSPLTAREADILFEVMRRLRERQFTLAFISHRLDEVLAISDRVTVLRDSKVVAEFDKPAKTSREQLVEAMVGHEIAKRERRHRDLSASESVLEVSGLSSEGRFRDISFAARRGEVLGFAGLVGSGRTEIAEAIFGLRPADGTVKLAGKPFTHRTPARCIKAGLIYLPEDRGHNGVFANVEVERNITAAIVPTLPRLGPLLSPHAEYAIAEKAAEQTRVVTPSLEAPIRALSGGNQQRAMFSRWLLAKPKVAIFDEPTRGVDVGAKADIYGIIDSISDDGVAVVMISSELEELVLVCDRVIAIYEGQIVGEVVGDDITLERLGAIVVEGKQK